MSLPLPVATFKLDTHIKPCSQKDTHTRTYTVLILFLYRVCVCAFVCVVRSVNERNCVEHFPNPAEAQSVHQTYVTDSTPFRKNAVLPPP